VSNLCGCPQVCWDEHNERVLFYVGSMTFAYEPRRRAWRPIHAIDVKDQPPGGVSTREAVYVPDADAVLTYGPDPRRREAG